MRYKYASASLLALVCVACAPVGPDYVRPKTQLPETWKSVAGAEQFVWNTTSPKDGLAKSDWWTVFGDAQLNQLEEQCLANNANLQAAVAKVAQAKAQYGIQFAAQLPSLQAGATVSDQRISADRPLSSYTTPNYSTIQNNFSPFLSASYEFDWIGRVRRLTESANASLEQAKADKENTQLLLTGQLALAYFKLRQLDEETTALTDSIALQEKVLLLITKRHDLGLASDVDIQQQIALAESTKAQLEILKGQRNELEDMIATLTGVPAAGFHLALGKLPETLPHLPLSVPSTLLERRPDIASAERAMAAANAQIGVAKAAYYPMLTLSPALIGYQSNSMATLLSVPAMIWGIGVSATQTLFDGGKTSSGVDYASAGYSLALANYKQTVLSGIQDAQDALGNVQQLALARSSQEKSLASLNKALKLATLRYEAGLDNSLTLSFVQQNQLLGVRAQAQIKGSQFASSVGLVKALGGFWISSNEDVLKMK